MTSCNEFHGFNLSAKEPKKKGKDQAEKDTGGQREVECEISFSIDHIAGQPPKKRNAPGKGQQQPEGDDPEP
jgi:hypothetical protein